MSITTSEGAGSSRVDLNGYLKMLLNAFGIVFDSRSLPKLFLFPISSCLVEVDIEWKIIEDTQFKTIGNG